MFQDRKGNIWFGMDGTGVCKYDPSAPLRPGSGQALRTDGTSFTYFTMHDGLCDNSIVCVLEDRSGNMWFSSRFGGVSRYDGASFTNFTAPDDIGDNEVWTLHEDQSGAIWFVSEGFGVYRYDGKTLTNFAEKEGLPVLAAQCIFEDREGRFWVGGYGGLYRREGGTFVNVRRGGPWGGSLNSWRDGGWNRAGSGEIRFVIEAEKWTLDNVVHLVTARGLRVSASVRDTSPTANSR